MKIGIIGGSGLYALEGFEAEKWTSVETPFGEPSDEFLCGEIEGHEVVFLPRHGRGHRLLPSEINHRANIFGFKKLGVKRILSVTAVGSLHEDIKPEDVVVPDQYFDRTRCPLEHTFFGNGLVAHISFGDPVCDDLRKQMLRACTTKVHDGGVYVNIQGPAFSTRAESNFYRSCGFRVVGMTSLPEAKLSREAEICYACMAMVTDYDCWHDEEEDVSVELVMETLRHNTQNAQKTLINFFKNLEPVRPCQCGNALAGAIMTASESIPPEIKTKLGPIIQRYDENSHSS